VWFVLGGIIGPLAVVLLLVAPPGACPECGARIRGWPRACEACGASLGGAVSVAGPASAPQAAPATGPVVVRTISGPVETGTPRPRPVLVPSPSAERPVLVEPRSEPVGAVAAADRTDRDAARRRYRHEEDLVAPGARLIGSGIYLGGTAPSSTKVARLEVGDRYGLARDGDELHILGPVTIDPERVVARVPIAGAEVELVADRLVVQGGPAARGLALAFANLSVARGTDVVAILRAPSEQATG
jgi:hypothetical protein